jgi:hypothetical protein
MDAIRALRPILPSTWNPGNEAGLGWAGTQPLEQRTLCSPEFHFVEAQGRMSVGPFSVKST